MAAFVGGAVTDLDRLALWLLVVPATLAATVAFMLPVATPPSAIVFGSRHLAVGQVARAGVCRNLVAIVLNVARRPHPHHGRPPPAVAVVTGPRVLARSVVERTLEPAEVRVIDLEPLLVGPVFEPLVNDSDRFRQVTVDPDGGHHRVAERCRCLATDPVPAQPGRGTAGDPNHLRLVTPSDSDGRTSAAGTEERCQHLRQGTRLAVPPRAARSPTGRPPAFPVAPPPAAAIQYGRSPQDHRRQPGLGPGGAWLLGGQHDCVVRYRSRETFVGRQQPAAKTAGRRNVQRIPKW